MHRAVFACKVAVVMVAAEDTASEVAHSEVHWVESGLPQRLSEGHRHP